MPKVPGKQTKAQRKARHKELKKKIKADIQLFEKMVAAKATANAKQFTIKSGEESTSYKSRDVGHKREEIFELLKEMNELAFPKKVKNGAIITKTTDKQP